MRLGIILAMLAGASIAVQTVFNVAGQRGLGVPLLVATSGFTTGFVGLAASLFLVRPELTGRTVGYGVASGVLGAFIVGSIAFAASQGGVARALSLVVGTQLIAGLILDSLGLLGVEAAFTIPKAVGVGLIVIGGVLLIRF